ASLCYQKNDKPLKNNELFFYCQLFSVPQYAKKPIQKRLYLQFQYLQFANWQRIDCIQGRNKAQE
ncbi:MAG: hypothetical protein DRR19_09110, partial [Candidatus Parabeggiatoa sp. nov. 1]